MTYEEATRKIKNLIGDQWSDVTTILWPNEIEDSLGDPDYYARVSILPSSGSQVAVGGNMHRREGVTIIQLFARQGYGLSALAALEEKAVQIFTENTLSGIRFYDEGADRIGVDGNGYYQSNVVAAFQFDVS